MKPTWSGKLAMLRNTYSFGIETIKKAVSAA
jgi:hypothetical protein